MNGRQGIRKIGLTVIMCLAVALLCFLGTGNAFAMTDGTNCQAAGCHSDIVVVEGTSNTHVLVECYECHNGTDLWLEGLPGVKYAMIGAHDYDEFAECDFCHNSDWPAVPQHSTSPAHPTDTSPFTECASCHNPDLVNEHDTHQPFTCATCHSPSAPALTQIAIAARNSACSACHPDYQAAHDFHADAITPACTECHGSELIPPHASCDSCHPGGNWSAPAGQDCASCHPDYTEPHGDYTAAHLGVWEPECAYQCHGSDLVATHNGDCAGCHDGPVPLGGATCFTCHPTYHTNATVTPASSPWSLALIAGLGLGAVLLVIRRERTSV